MILNSALAHGDGFLERDLDGRSNEHDRDDLNEITGQERNDASGQGGSEGHLSLSNEPRSADKVEGCGCKNHGDDHCSVFAGAGFVSAKAVV